jgi:hypothetical protein
MMLVGKMFLGNFLYPQKHYTMFMKITKIIPWVILGANFIIPNDVVKDSMTSFFYKMGVTLTFGMSKHPAIGPLWNKTIEPVFVDFIDNMSYSIQHGFVKGLRSDNEEVVNSSLGSQHQSEISESSPKSDSEILQ